ncbi:hypothetical protein [Sphingomonas sp.]|jgi:hypothetical protein|uniref:hypothetical protein n=1 Tax=Sphingomonas sp. TaxID=28214 RepID=UPI002EDB9CA2
MRNYTKLAIGAVATAGLLIGPMAVAGTRAAANVPAVSAAKTALTGTRFSSRSTKVNGQGAEGIPVIAIVGGVAAAALLIVVVTDGDSDG